MYTPFTLSIYRGVLSPDRLEERGIAPGQFLLAARQLELCDDTEDAVCACISALVPGYSLPPFSMADVVRCSATSSASSFCVSPFQSSLLCPLRQAEMEYTALTGCSWSSYSPLAAFYAALLRAEARCLLRWLSHCFPRLHSAEEARMLLSRVLDEVYDQGAMMGDTPSVSVWWRRMLKEGMASLYLDLTADFSYLLESDDFLDYPALFSSSAYITVCPPDREAFARSALLHDVHIKGNKVRRLLSLHGRDTSCVTARVQELKSCYAALLTLWPLLKEVSSSRSHLLSTLRALEDTLYFATCPYTGQQVYDYRLLHDAAWNSEQAESLYSRYYSTHYRSSQSRTASYQLEAYLHHRSLAFLGDTPLPTDSIPRLLKQRILHHLDCYTRCFDATFRPLMPEKGFAEVPAPAHPLEPNVHDLHRLMSFFTDRKDVLGHPLMQPDEAERLERVFLEFLHGRRLQEPVRPLSIPKRFNEIFYGFFFHYHQVCGGGTKELYAHFLLQVFAVDVKVEVLVKNYSRCIRAYVKFAEI